jgi:prepilin-type N-terminal cleavage/methylation domain-containing protein
LPHPAAGFTLLELMVVIMLLSILLGFAIPAFQKGQGKQASGDAVRGLLHAVRELKAAALRRQEILKLHLNLDENRIWVTHEGKGQEESGQDPPSDWTLSDDVQIAHVRFPDNREIRSGNVVIVFYPQGYSDRAIVRLIDGGSEPTDLVVEAFLPMAFIAAKHETTAF